MIGKKWVRVFALLLAALVLAMVILVFLLTSLFDITSSNAVLYVVSHSGGYFEITNYISPMRRDLSGNSLTRDLSLPWYRRSVPVPARAI